MTRSEQQAEIDEPTMHAAGEPENGTPPGQRSLLQRLWERVRLIGRWIVRPNKVGKPVTIQPASVRVLVLLILGNVIILALLTFALFQDNTPPTAEGPVVLVVATATAGPTRTAGPSPTPLGRGGAIAFTMRRGGNVDIYALNQAERQLVRLTHDRAEDRNPAWSPDGNQIAFASNRAHNWDIYLLDLVSGKLIRETQDAGFDGNPSWSPDGEYIAFESYRRGNLDIYVMSTSGGEIQRITRDPAPDYEPAWSPDSRAIAFTSSRGGNKDIYLYLVEQEQSINITNSPDIDEDHAAWSPDGTRLAYASGPRGNPSIQVTTFDWQAMAVDQAQTELFGAGASPAWAPDGQNLLYAAYEREEHSHLIAASMTSWGQFQKVYSIDGLIDDLTWSDYALSPRVVDRARAAAPSGYTPIYVEMVQPTPTAGPPYALVPLLGVSVGREMVVAELEEEQTGGEGDEGEEGDEATATATAVAAAPAIVVIEDDAEQPLVSDRVNESFAALRQRVIEEAGWDYLGSLSTAWLSTTHAPPSGHSRMSWHVCGRAIGLNQEPLETETPQIELVREDVGNVTYWRIFIRAAEQDGSMGEPLREAVWDLAAREDGGPALVEGGTPKERIPVGYYVDLTTLANDYGWERLPSLWRWRYFWPDIRWWELEKTDDLTWWECMLEVFDPEEIEDAFGPIPGYED